MNLSEKTAMVIDNGLFVEFASRLSRDYKKVYYYTPWEASFPKQSRGFLGMGIKGVTRVDSVFGPHFDEVDVFAFPDLYFGPLQLYLQGLGKAVWGARMGEELELYREDLKAVMRRLGLPVGPLEIVKGMEALRKYLRTHEDVYVKTNKWRGTMETFHSASYRASEPKLDEIEKDLGAFKTITEFLVEESLPDKVEVGIDAYCVDGEYPTKMLCGIEVKDTCYVARFVERAKLPEPMTRFDRLMAPTLKRFGYRGFYSTEVRIGKDQQPYMIDFCAGAGSPPNELYQEFYINLSEIVWAAAHGKCIDPKPIGKFGAEAMILSTWADNNWQAIDFPEKFKQNVKLKNAVKIDGRYYTVPQHEGLVEVGAVVGWGSTLDEAIDQVKEIAKSVEGYYIKIQTNGFDDAAEQIEKLDKFGMNYFK